MSWILGDGVRSHVGMAAEYVDEYAGGLRDGVSYAMLVEGDIVGASDGVSRH